MIARSQGDGSAGVGVCRRSDPSISRERIFGLCFKSPRRLPSGRSVRRGRRDHRGAVGSRPCRYGSVEGLPVWPNRDPSFETGGINLYGFVRNRPVIALDPLGLQEQLPLPPGFHYYSPGAGDYGDWVPGIDFEDCLYQADYRRRLRDMATSRWHRKVAPGPVPGFGHGLCPEIINLALEAAHLAEMAHQMGEANARREESKRLFEADAWACGKAWAVPVMLQPPAQ
jgi:hypothetical protein